MDLTWTDADDGTETRMELSTLEHKLALVRVDIIVELVKVGKSCEPRAVVRECERYERKRDDVL